MSGSDYSETRVIEFNNVLPFAPKLSSSRMLHDNKCKHLKWCHSAKTTLYWLLICKDVAVEQRFGDTIYQAVSHTAIP